MTAVPVWLIFIAGIVAIAASLYALHRLALWMERKDWLYYRRKRPETRGGMGVLSTFQQFVEPEIRHVIEEKEQRKAESDTAAPSDR